MTSNIGARHLQKNKGLGFSSDREDMVMDKIEEMVKSEVKRTFTRNSSTASTRSSSSSLCPTAISSRFSNCSSSSSNANLVQKAITISVAEDAKKWILEKTLVDRSYGARPLRRALQRYVEDPLSEALIAGNISERPAFLEVYLENNNLFYRGLKAEGEEKSEGVLL